MSFMSKEMQDQLRRVEAMAEYVGLSFTPWQREYLFNLLEARDAE